MKKIAVLATALLMTGFVMGQAYYNEWIDFSKTYYRFKVGSTGLYRINISQLAAVGLDGSPAQQFQLWRNGKEVPIYTSAATGPLGAGGYIEFWGERNDGVTDKDLYRVPANQLSNRLSLITDTAAFFLTLNTGANLRYSATANNVAGNTLPAETWFMYNARKDFQERIHRGKALVAGSEYVYSSSYETGEMWSTNDIYSSTPVTFTFQGLAVAAGGPTANISASTIGSAPNFRQYNIEVNNVVEIDSTLSQFEAVINTKYNIPLSLLSSNTANIRIVNKSANPNDRIVCGFVDLQYPRQFDFGNQNSFEFYLPASGSKKYLEINNFDAGSSTPVLYDISNQRRYVADVSGSTYRFVIQPSTVNTRFVLVSQANSAFISVPNLQQRNFINYSITANQGDYLVITHSSLHQLYNGADQIDEYMAYRNSASGGSFNAKTYDIDQVVDQFGYGIKKKIH